MIAASSATESAPQAMSGAKPMPGLANGVDGADDEVAGRGEERPERAGRVLVPEAAQSSRS